MRTPTICCLQAGEPAGSVIQSESEGLRIRSTNARGQEKMDVSAQVESIFTLPQHFCPVQVLRGLDDAHPHWWGLMFLLSLLIDSDSNLFQRHLHRNNVLPVIWVSLSPVKLTHTINHYNSRTNITRDQSYGKLGSKLRHTLVFFNWCSSQLGKRVPQFFDNVQWMAGR